MNLAQQKADWLSEELTQDFMKKIRADIEDLKTGKVNMTALEALQGCLLSMVDIPYTPPQTRPEPLEWTGQQKGHQ